MKNNIILFSAFHKHFVQPNTDWIVPIQVGKAISDTDLGFLGDNTGDNISSLNPIFCELTMAYWIWKNADRSQHSHWGLMHYRRYLSAPNLAYYISGKKSIIIKQQQLNDYINEKTKANILKDLQDYDVIMPFRRRLKIEEQKMTLEEQFKTVHCPDHWDIMKQVLLEKYPEYEQSLQLFYKSKRMYYGNMMIASWKMWDHYLEWLFDILFEVLQRINIPDDMYQKRVSGFLSERLLDLYMYHHKPKIKRYLTINLE